MLAIRIYIVVQVPPAYRAEGPHSEQLFGVSRKAPRRPLSRSLTTNTKTCPASGPAPSCMERKAVLPSLLSPKMGLMAHKAHTFFRILLATSLDNIEVRSSKDGEPAGW